MGRNSFKGHDLVGSNQERNREMSKQGELQKHGVIQMDHERMAKLLDLDWKKQSDEKLSGLVVADGKIWERVNAIDTRDKDANSAYAKQIASLEDRCKALEDLLCGLSNIELRIQKAGAAATSLSGLLLKVADVFERSADSIKEVTDGLAQD